VRPPLSRTIRAEIGAAQQAITHAPSAAVAAGGRARVTPLVRRIAQELGVDLEGVQASGPGSRITEDDVRRAAPPVPIEDARREPLRGVRRLIAEHLTRSHREVPAVTVVEECDFTRLDEIRGPRTYLPYLLEAAASALQAFPELNATLEGDEIVFWQRYDLGLAVQTDEGLVVPVLRGADERSLDELEGEARRLSEAALAGTLKPEELRGSTFTVTSAGKLGGLFATPLVNFPEVAILGLHRIADRHQPADEHRSADRPAVRDGEIVARRVGWLSCTFDHRVVDGARASAFLLDVIERLERPAD